MTYMYIYVFASIFLCRPFIYDIYFLIYDIVNDIIFRFQGMSSNQNNSMAGLNPLGNPMMSQSAYNSNNMYRQGNNLTNNNNNNNNGGNMRR